MNKMGNRITKGLAVILFVSLSENAFAAEYKGRVVGPLAENDGYYAILSEGQFKYMGWDEARRYAASLYIIRGGKTYRGFLATPNTPTENAFIKNALSPTSHWFGLFQKPGARSPSHNWYFLNNRSVQWSGWSSGQPDDQKGGSITRCTLTGVFDGSNFASGDEGFSFGIGAPYGENGCENCGIMGADGKWNDKECKSHGNGFLVEFRNL